MRAPLWLLLSGLLIAGLNACLTAPIQSTSPTAISSPKDPTTPTANALLTVTPSAEALPSPQAITTPVTTIHLLLTNSTGYHITRLEPESGQFDQLEVGAAPWGIVLSPDHTVAYVATAQGVAVVDLASWQRTVLVAYTTPLGTPQFGEYRPGGMGIAIAPEGNEVYVGVYTGSGASRLEILDTEQLAITDNVTVGVRPFQLLASKDGHRVYSIDHDSFTVTMLDLPTRTTQTLPATPLGSTSVASFDKPHYAVLDERGHLLLPYQGRLLLDLDPLTGFTTTVPLSANTHQHGIAWSADARTLLIVGTGPAGNARGGASLTLLDWASGNEVILPLTRPHEHVAVSPDGQWAYLTGGHSFANGGWNGIAVVDLADHTMREISVPDRPLDIVVLP